jgi:hypothetical protein
MILSTLEESLQLELCNSTGTDEMGLLSDAILDTWILLNMKSSCQLVVLVQAQFMVPFSPSHLSAKIVK